MLFKMIGIRILINVTGTLLLCFSLLIWTFFTNMVSSCSSSSSGCDTQLVEAITVLKLLLLRIVTQLNLNKHVTCTFGFSVTNPFLGCHYHKFDIKQVPKTPESSRFKVFFNSNSENYFRKDILNHFLNNHQRRLCVSSYK